MFLLIIIFIIIIILILESDRNYIISYSFKDYYIKFFPKQIIFGIHNSIYRFFHFQTIYSVNKFVSFDKYLLDNKETIKNEFKKFKFKDLIDENLDTPKDNHPIIEENYYYIFFKRSKKIYYKNLIRFPTIYKLLVDNNNIHNCLLSVIEKKKIIDFHRGSYNGILRYHFPVIMDPNNYDKCYIEILNDSKLYYNKSFLFDDTIPHKLVKLDDNLRLSLICDIDNPLSYIHVHKNFKF